VILDLCSRFAVGWAMNERITADLTLDALGMACAPAPAAGAAPSFRSRQSVRQRRLPSASWPSTGIVVQHEPPRAIVGTTPWPRVSSRRLKVELVHDATWAKRTAARTEAVRLLEVFYNGQRRHFGARLSQPAAFERRPRTGSGAT